MTRLLYDEFAFLLRDAAAGDEIQQCFLYPAENENARTPDFSG